MALIDLIFSNASSSRLEPRGLVALGKFQFGVDSIPYQTIDQDTPYEWAEIPLMGADPALQFTGNGVVTISMGGVFYPTVAGGYAQMPKLKAEANKGKPLSMVDSNGNSLGEWVIANISENHAKLRDDGSPRRIDFTITLKRYKR